MAQAVLLVGLLLLLASLFTTLFRRTQIPDVLELILLGILIGPVLHWVHPDDFGKAGAFMSTIALVVILFESGVSLSLKALSASIRDTLGLTLGHFLVSMGVVATITHYWLGTPMLLSLFLGAALGGTAAAVVIPMVKVLRLREQPATVLVLESALTDVLCIVVALAFLDAAVSGLANPGRVVGNIVTTFLFAVVAGGLAAVVWLAYLDAVRELPFQIFTMLAYLFVVYGVAELLGFSGGIAAFSFGFVITSYDELGLGRLRRLAHLRLTGPALPPAAQEFLLEVVFVLKTFFFLYLGLSVTLGDRGLVLPAAATMLALLLGRGIVTWATVSRTTSRRDAGLMALMTPKGLAPAVLAAVPLRRGIEGAETLQQFTYMVVISSILIVSVLIPLLQTRVGAGACAALFRRFAPDHS